MDLIETFLLVSGFAVGFYAAWFVRNLIEQKRLIDYPPKKRR